jgi:telomere length regulation protein
MVVGECLSNLVDKTDKKLDFHMDETEADEAKALKALVTIDDKVGPTTTLLRIATTTSGTLPSSSLLTAKPKKPASVPRSKPSIIKAKAIIEEVDSEDDEEDLVPYAKNSDPEDSDEDPTLVQRNKTKPPVYVRDLIAFLRDSDSYDKQKLGLETAPLLIRRKANYGTEVSSHAEELAKLLVGIQDKFELEDFGEMKLRAIVSLIVSQPKTMAPWFARTFFEGDFSLAQRSTLLVALGVSARELGGFHNSGYEASTAFPSKKLPEKIEQLYISASDKQQPPPASRLKALPATALDTITQSLTSKFLEPIAAEAADTATGPDAIKLQTFTARYKSKSVKRPRVRAIPNTTAAIISGSFFSPLTAYFQVALRSSKPFVLNPALLGLYLQTLGVIIHSAGPSTLSLPQLTSELWYLLLRVRQHVIGDMAGTKGWFVAMAALLEVNEGDMRKLCETQGREVVETREWASAVFERTRGEDGGEENEVKMLAAGVLIRLGEAIEKYQALLMGDMIGFT